MDTIVSMVLPMLNLKLLSESDVQVALAKYLRGLREQQGLTRDELARRSTVPSATLKKFEMTGQISLRQLLLLWQCLDDLSRIYRLTEISARPNSIDEVLKDGF